MQTKYGLNFQNINNDLKIIYEITLVSTLFMSVAMRVMKFKLKV